MENSCPYSVSLNLSNCYNINAVNCGVFQMSKTYTVKIVITSDNEPSIAEIEKAVRAIIPVIEIKTSIQGEIDTTDLNNRLKAYWELEDTEKSYSGQKIRAIKYHREVTGSGLKEAKEYVDEMWVKFIRGEM